MKHRSSVLIIAPLPPPITGSSIASQLILDYLRRNSDVYDLSYSKQSLDNNVFSLDQALRVITIGIKIIIKRLLRNHFDAAYLVVSCTFWGNIRDLLFLALLGKNLRKKLTIHRHGAHFKDKINTFPKIIQFLNLVLLRDVKRAVVLGNSLVNIFDGYVPSAKVAVIVNSFAPDLLIPTQKFNTKWNNSKKIEVLFLSNMIIEKGYRCVLDAFLLLPKNLREQSKLHFAGQFAAKQDENAFNEKIVGHNNIIYHGVISGEQKRDLFWQSHIFCLPSFFLFEGQPISILEAYAAGCLVVTTTNGGICDIFENETNGYAIDLSMTTQWEELQLTQNLNAKLTELVGQFISRNSEHLLGMAHHNWQLAQSNYSQEKFCKNLRSVILSS